MTLEFVDNYINNKINESKDKNMIVFTFYELRIKCNLSERETDNFLGLAKNKFENMGYLTYFTGAEFTYNDVTRIVQDNELMVTVKK